MTPIAPGLTPVREVLDNGVVLLVQENRTVPAVAVTASFDAGSVTDPDGQPGVAYLAAKTIDRGTQARTADAIADLLDERGVSLRVAVRRHTFSLSSVCLSGDLDDVLPLMAEIVRRATFPVDQIEKRRLKAVTSVREDADSTASRASATAHQLLYGADHPYGRPRKGTVASLERVTRARLLDFASTWLAPGALRLAIAGDVRSSDAIRLATRLFSTWPSRPRPLVIVPPPPVPHRSGRVLEMRGKSQTDIAYALSTLPRLDPGYYTVLVMNTILGQFGLGGRLADNIRERQGLAYYAYSTLDAMPADCPLVIRVGVDPAHTVRALDAIQSEIQRLAADGPGAREFADAVDSLVGGVARTLETNENLTEFLLTCEAFGLGTDHDRRLPELLRAVTPADVTDAARAILDPRGAAIAVAGPMEGTSAGLLSEFFANVA